MNVKELKQIIEKLPDHMDIFVSERKTEYSYGLVNSARVKKINMVDEPDGEVLSTETVLLLDEE